MPGAARLNDSIGHSPTMSWLTTGLCIGAAIGVCAVLTVGTGGLAGAAIIGGLAAGGAGIGEFLSTLSWAPKEKSGFLFIFPPLNVLINGKFSARAHIDVAICSIHSQQIIATGSASVYINGQPAARIDDKLVCGGVIVEGSKNVIIGGGTEQTDIIKPEDLVPGWVHWSIFGVGTASVIVLAGPVVAFSAIIVGMAGGEAASWIGGKFVDKESDAYKWMVFGGSFVGFMLGAKGGSILVNKIIPVPQTTLMSFIKGGYPAIKPRCPLKSHIKSDISKKVFVNGKYVKNPKAQNLIDVITPEGKIFDKSSSGKFMYVIDELGNFIIGKRARSDSFPTGMPHPTLIGGKNPKVLGAGELYIKGGKIYWINNKSGHYQHTNSLSRAHTCIENINKNLNKNLFHPEFKGYVSHELFPTNEIPPEFR